MIVILVILFGVLGYLLGKYIYDRVRVRTKRINEVDEDYDYKCKNSEEKNNKEKNEDVVGQNKLGIDVDKKDD